MRDNRIKKMKPVVGNERGIALFLVLGVLALLAVIVGEFCYTMRTQVNITRNFKEETQAYYLAVAGANRAIVELIRNERIPPKATTVEDEEEERLRINTDIPPVSFGEGRFKVHVTNESGKINLNAADTRLLRMVLTGFDLEDDERDVIVDSILDWRDKDRLHRVNGAEDDYYQSLPEPYECRDDDFRSVAELLLVRGVTPELFFGGLEEMVTVYGDDQADNQSGNRRAPRKKPAAASGKMNINAATFDMLRTLPGMTEDLARDIVEFRKERDFKTVTELLELVGADVYNSLQSYLTVRTIPYYTVTAMGMTGGGETRRAVEALVKIDGRSKKGYRIIRWLDDAPVTESLRGIIHPEVETTKSEG